jgi:hypothetical protein
MRIRSVYAIKPDRRDKDKDCIRCVYADKCVYGAYTYINAYTQRISNKKQIEEIKIKSVYGAYRQINAYTVHIRYVYVYKCV